MADQPLPTGAFADPDALARWILAGDDDEHEPVPFDAPRVAVADGWVHRADAERVVTHVRERRAAGRGGWLAGVTAETVGAPTLADAGIRLPVDLRLAAGVAVAGGDRLRTTGPARLVAALAAGLDPRADRLVLVVREPRAATSLLRPIRAGRPGHDPVGVHLLRGRPLDDPAAFDDLEIALFEHEATVVVLAVPDAEAAALVLALRDVLPEAWFVTVPPPAPVTRDAAGLRRAATGTLALARAAVADRRAGASRVPPAAAAGAGFPGWD